MKNFPVLFFLSALHQELSPSASLKTIKGLVEGPDKQ
jgi:hypothetical protein